MAGEIVVPSLGESVSEATIAKWFKQPGDAVKADEPLVELETDKVTVEVNAPASGVLKEVLAKEGSNVETGAILGRIDVGAAGGKAAAAPAKAEAPKAAAPAAAPAQKTPAALAAALPANNQYEPAERHAGATNGPAVTKMLAENPQVNAAAISGSGKDGRLTKGDVLGALNGDGMGQAPAAGPREERVKMTKLRSTIARRLKESQNTAATLTTFNEVDLKALMELRARHKDRFEKEHGVKLGFMSFFVKATIEALKRFPVVNAYIEGSDILYHDYYDIGVAVSTDRGLVVPVLRDAEMMSFADIEGAIAGFGKRAREGAITIEELTGGTFTITNGGVFGSLMSTPIVNAPQSAILGMHKIQERPIAVDGQVVIRPMMYIALTYDHRIIDGREAVQFLVSIKDSLEDPARMLLQV